MMPFPGQLHSRRLGWGFHLHSPPFIPSAHLQKMMWESWAWGLVQVYTCPGHR